jgi:hypothetical protein
MQCKQMNTTPKWRKRQQQKHGSNAFHCICRAAMQLVLQQLLLPAARAGRSTCTCCCCCCVCMRLRRRLVSDPSAFRCVTHSCRPACVYTQPFVRPLQVLCTSIKWCGPRPACVHFLVRVSSDFRFAASLSFFLAKPRCLLVSPSVNRRRNSFITETNKRVNCCAFKESVSDPCLIN